jgi:hypothetical protein
MALGRWVAARLASLEAVEGRYRARTEVDARAVHRIAGRVIYVLAEVGANSARGSAHRRDGLAAGLQASERTAAVGVLLACRAELAGGGATPAVSRTAPTAGRTDLTARTREGRATRARPRVGSICG